MRFSIRWALAGMAYAALAAAALTQGKWYYSEPLWCVTFVAVGLAMVLALFARGRRQIAAAGFVAFAGCYVACLWQNYGDTPTRHLLLLAGKPEVQLLVVSMEQSEPGSFAAGGGSRRGVMYHDVYPYVRAAHTTSVMLAGLLGAVLAPLPFRRGAGRSS